MRLAIHLAVILAAAFPAGAWAQGGSGAASPDAATGDSDSGPAAIGPAANEPDAAASAPGSPARGAAASETDVAAEDRVKSVQHKPFLKQGRFEITPLGFMTLNDAFFPKYGPAIRAAYHVHDSLALGLRLNQYNLISSEDLRLAKRELQARLPAAQPKVAVAFDVMWAPIYGKVSIFNTIQHFDLYLVGGVGAVRSQTSPTDGLHLSTHLGVGQRFSLTDFMTVDISLLETIYSDRLGAAGTVDGNRVQLQHGLALQAGLGFFLPFSSSDYHEP